MNYVGYFVICLLWIAILFHRSNFVEFSDLNLLPAGITKK